MPDTIGALIISAEAAATVAATLSEATGLAITAAGVTSAVGGATILAASIGLQYALNNPDVPKPENGSVPLKQGIMPRIRGYWINRLSGPYLLFIAAGGNSQDMIAFHSGRIEQVLQIYLHDDAVTVHPDPAHNVTTTVATIGADRYAGVNIEIFYGTDSQNSSDMLNASNTSGIWTSDFHGAGIACLAMYCQNAGNPGDFTKAFPQGLPLPSVVARCSPIWDPRDTTQSRFDKSTWKASPNAVLQLIDYLTEPDGGMGLNLDVILPPDILALWMDEADLCEGRYLSAGFYQFDNAPENVIGKNLSTCDGWMVPGDNGTLLLTVGVYRDPIEAPIPADQVVGLLVKYGMADEETINQLDVTYTNPDAGYVSDQIESVRDEAAISLTGVVRAKPLDLSWVQDPVQANILAQRALLRANPKISGTLVTTLYGLNYTGKRWVALQFPDVPGMEDCIIEIQDKAQIDVLGGRVTFTWNLVDRDALIALGSTPPVMSREDSSFYRREDGSLYRREAA